MQSAEQKDQQALPGIPPVAATVEDNSFEQFFTREVARGGIKVNLPSRTGVPTKHWIILRHIDSDEFRRAKAISLSKRLEIYSEQDLEKRIDLFDELRMEQLASLVAGWSFEQELNQANVIRLMKNAPYIADMVDLRSKDSQLFFGDALKTS